jgi:hypothetical protein
MATESIGLPGPLLEKVKQAAAKEEITPEDEVTSVLRREKFGWPEVEIDRALTQISRFAEHVESKERIDTVAEDPTDDRILECAVAPGLNILSPVTIIF